MGGRTDGSTTDCWQCGRFYRGWAMERVVEPAVLPWIDGRRRGSRIFDYEMVFVDKVILGFEVCFVGQNKVIPIDFSLRNGFCR